MAERKHLSELALGFFSKGLLALHPKNLKKLDQEPEELVSLSDNCHIYLIVTRPRVGFVPDSFEIKEGKTYGRLWYVKEGQRLESSFYFIGEANADSIEVSGYPNAEMYLVKDGECFFTLPANLAVLKFDYLEDNSLRDLKVEYIGKSFADGNRSAKDRLQNHSTLQQVLSDVNYNAPDLETLLLLVEFEYPQTLVSFDGRDESLRHKEDRDVVEDISLQEKLITEDVQISLIEAGLIKYFQPKYNYIYKDRFPDRKHSILEELYKIDFSALTVEINTEEISSRIYSESTSFGKHHISSFDLHETDVRRSIYKIADSDSGPDASDISGAVY